MANNSNIPVTEEEASWIASFGVISNPLGALAAGIIMEIFGRKTAVQISSIPYVVGWVLIAISDNIFKIYTGRFITGLAAGMTSATYIYVAEISQPQYRGTLSACGPVLVSFGVLIVYTLGFFTSWQQVSAICISFSAVSFIAMCCVPESPQWLVVKGKNSDAILALVWFRNSTVTAEREFQEILETVSKERNNNIITSKVNTPKSQIYGYFKQFKKPICWKPFSILVFFFLFQEGSGIYIVLYYAVNLFQQIGAGFNEYIASIIVGGVRLIMSIIGTVLIQNFGRKILAVMSGLGMAFSMAAGGMYEYFFSQLPSSERPFVWVPLVCVLIHVCVSMVGFLQLPWIMVGEVFPLSVRGVMSGIVTFLAHIFIFISVKTYPSVMHSLGMDGILWLFSLTALSGAAFSYIFLPETKGRSLNEIESFFKTGYFEADTEIQMVKSNDNNHVSDRVIQDCKKENA